MHFIDRGRYLQFMSDWRWEAKFKYVWNSNEMLGLHYWLQSSAWNIIANYSAAYSVIIALSVDW